jgi:hypothetical protein
VNWYSWHAKVVDGLVDEKGYFDLRTDSEFINLRGDYTSPNLHGYEYQCGFPTRFLWEDYKETVVAHIKQCQEATKKIRSELWAKKRALRASIRSKLTPEELEEIEEIKWKSLNERVDDAYARNGFVAFFG